VVEEAAIEELLLKRTVGVTREGKDGGEGEEEEEEEEVGGRDSLK